MTFYYRTQTWNSSPQPDQHTINKWKHLADKTKWRIVQLPTGFYQTEYQHEDDEDLWIDVTRRETIEGAESAIDGSINHYKTKVEFAKGPKVVKTFKE